MKLDRIVAAGFFLVGAIIAREASHLPYASQTSPGPGFFPLWLGISLMGLSALLFVTTRRRDVPFVESAAGFKKMALLVVAFLVYAFVLDSLGLLISLSLLVFFLLGYLERRGWKTWLTGGLVISLGCYLLFKVWLGVPLPLGILGI